MLYAVPGALLFACREILVGKTRVPCPYALIKKLQYTSTRPCHCARGMLRLYQIHPLTIQNCVHFLYRWHSAMSQLIVRFEVLHHYTSRRHFAVQKHFTVKLHLTHGEHTAALRHSSMNIISACRRPSMLGNH